VRSCLLACSANPTYRKAKLAAASGLHLSRTGDVSMKHNVGTLSGLILLTSAAFATLACGGGKVVVVPNNTPNTPAPSAFAAPATPPAVVATIPATPVYPQDTVEGPSPGSNYVWAPGYYNWAGDHYVWVPGAWMKTPSPSAVWVPGKWQPTAGGYTWVAGHWQYQ
jgi:WXXGXW repeat (2 copies)